MLWILIFTYTRCSYLRSTEWNTLHVPWHQLCMYVVQAFAIAGPYPPCTASQSCPQPERHLNCFLAPAKNISCRGTSVLMRGGSLIMRCTYLCIDMDITLFVERWSMLVGSTQRWGMAAPLEWRTVDLECSVIVVLSLSPATTPKVLCTYLQPACQPATVSSRTFFQLIVILFHFPHLKKFSLSFFLFFFLLLL